MKWDERLLKQHLKQFQYFVTPLLATLGRSERRGNAARYIEGLLIPGERKSMEPMAERLQVDVQSLQQMITDSPWEERAVWAAIQGEVVPSLEPLEAWIVDETGWLKQGKDSVGVSHQYCGAVGKQANCQVSVELGVSDGWVVAPIGGRLYLPQSWTEDRERCARAGVPAEIQFATRTQLAIELIKEAVGNGVARAPVLADAMYGDSADFRAELRRLRLEYFLQVTPTEHKGWPEPVKSQVKRTRHHVEEGTPPAATLAQLAAQFPKRAWKKCEWTSASGNTRNTRLAWCEVYLQVDLQYGPLEKHWLVVDWPEGDPGPYQHYLACLNQPPTRARCLRLSRSRWQIEQQIQRSKTNLGLDHFEGRAWHGFHHHLVLCAIAYLFVLTVYLRSKKNFWCDVGTDFETDPALDHEVERLLSILSKQI
jgi:SRSO17 transposase